MHKSITAIEPNDTARFMEALQEAARKFGQRELASAMGITRKTLCDLLRQKNLLISKALERHLLQAIRHPECRAPPFRGS